MHALGLLGRPSERARFVGTATIVATNPRPPLLWLIDPPPPPQHTPLNTQFATVTPWVGVPTA
eukprot:5191863-Alexandrium_andersonii.AAC.1